MTKWKNLAGKFTEAEIEKIKKFQTKYGIKNSSQIVRASILFLIMYTEIMTKFIDSTYAKQADLQSKELKKAISKLPLDVKDPINLVVNKMQRDAIKTLEAIAEGEAQDLSSFLEKRKIGRSFVATPISLLHILCQIIFTNTEFSD